MTGWGVGGWVGRWVGQIGFYNPFRLSSEQSLDSESKFEPSAAINRDPYFMMAEVSLGKNPPDCRAESAPENVPDRATEWASDNLPSSSPNSVHYN